MPLWLRAWAYVTRKRIRASILFIVFAIISSSLYACIAVNMRMHNLDKRLDQATQNTLRVTRQDQQAMQVNAIASAMKHPDIVKKHYNYHTLAQSKRMQVVRAEQGVQLDTNSALQRVFGIQAVNNTRYHADFLNGRFRLVEGQHISKNGSQRILIHEELAKLNKLHVGSRVQLQGVELVDNNSMQSADTHSSQNIPAAPFDKRINSKISKEYRVAGIFTGTKLEHYQGFSSDLSQNTIITDYASAQALMTGSLKDYKADAVDIVVNYESNIAKVRAHLQHHLQHSKHYQISLLQSAYQKTRHSMLGLQTIISATVLIIILCGFVVLALLLMMSLRERMKEIGILLALGVAKLQILVQLMIELCYISVLSFIATILLGPTIEQFISRALIRNHANNVAGAVLSSAISVDIVSLIQTYGMILMLIVGVVALSAGLWFNRPVRRIMSVGR